MAEAAEQADCAVALPLSAVRRELDERLAGQTPSWAFLGGRVTFAALRAWRAIPVRVLCLVGMNDGTFPRNPPLPGFDLIAAHPRAGDRSMRDEDRHAFLEALLSAREVLYLSYSGRGIRDNAPLPPAAVVSELLDCIDRGFFIDAPHARLCEAALCSASPNLAPRDQPSAVLRPSAWSPEGALASTVISLGRPGGDDAGSGTSSFVLVSATHVAGLTFATLTLAFTETSQCS
jgi:hypothetical protein